MPGNASRDEVIRSWIEKSRRAARTPPCSRGRAAQGTPPCFLYVWQGKDLQEGEFVCVAAKGVTSEFCGCVAGKGVRKRRSENINHGTLGMEAKVWARKWRGIRGNGRRATIIPEFTV